MKKEPPDQFTDGDTCVNIANELVKALQITKNNDSRSLQKEIGPSEFGGCSRATWYRLNGQSETNQNRSVLAGVMGTAIHSYIKEAFRKLDPFEDRYILEREWTHPNLKGHADLYDKQEKMVVDWKSKTKYGLKSFPSVQQIWQVQLYGFLLNYNQMPVEKVALVGIPRDGSEQDIVYYVEEYNEHTVKQAFEWLDAIKNAQQIPLPERNPSFCYRYCGFYDHTGEVGCTGDLTIKRRV